MHQYREFLPPPTVRSHVLCLWIREADTTARAEIVPDGCVDIILHGDSEPLIVGPDTRAVTFASPGPLQTVGLRFNPGTAMAALGIPISDIVNTTVPLSVALGRAAHSARDRVLGVTGLIARALTLCESIASHCNAPDRRVVDAVNAIARNPGISSETLSERYDITPRHLRRLFDSQVGYGPRTLARVFRLQRALDRLDSDQVRLADVANDAGYADQAHMNRDFRQLAAVTPSHAVRRGSTVTMSDSFKTAFAVASDNGPL